MGFGGMGVNFVIFASFDNYLDLHSLERDHCQRFMEL